MSAGLEELERLALRMGARASLDASRARALTPHELAARLLEGEPEDARARAFVDGLVDVVRVLVEDFPDNIFWDLDYLVCRLWNAGDAADVERLAARVRGLIRGFGNKSVLRFRYAHDFLFGFDWARWVAREPEARAHIGPLDPPFLDYLESRCRQLLELIAENDAKYGPLEGPGFRNPFSFPREPSEEARLHRFLAREELIPVKAWRLDGERRWELPFTDLRVEAAQRLGIAREAES